MNSDDGYVKLVGDLMNETSVLAAHLYGLYRKEVEAWFKKMAIMTANGINLPQEFGDVLLITFVNLGEKAITAAMNGQYLSKHLDCEPLPALTVGGGMNHFLNATAIGNGIGLTGYGSDVKGVEGFKEQALIGGDEGLAACYALKQLRYVAIEGIDYSAKKY